MRENIAEDTGTMSQISVKATTTEKLGFIGRKEGLAAEAVVLLKEVPPVKATLRAYGSPRARRGSYPTRRFYRHGTI